MFESLIGKFTRILNDVKGLMSSRMNCKNKLERNVRYAEGFGSYIRYGDW